MAQGQWSTDNGEYQSLALLPQDTPLRITLKIQAPKHTLTMCTHTRLDQG